MLLQKLWVHLHSVLTHRYTAGFIFYHVHPQIDTKAEPFSHLLLHFNTAKNQRRPSDYHNHSPGCEEMGVIFPSGHLGNEAGRRVFKDFHLNRWGGQLPTSDQTHLFLCAGSGPHVTAGWVIMRDDSLSGLLRDSAWHRWTLCLLPEGRLSLSWWVWWRAVRVGGCVCVRSYFTRPDRFLNE